MDLKFSIIVPSYNQGSFIAETIDSILNQSYKNVEVLVIDGGSTDSTIEVLKTYGDKIFWLSEKDRGQTHAINKGLALAKGDIITFLNSDDYYLEGTLKTVAAQFQAKKEKIWLTGDYIIVNEQGKRIQSLVIKYKSFYRKFLSFNLLTVLNPINQPSTFFRRQLIEQLQNFKEDLHYTMDYEFWLRAIKIQKPIIVTDKLSAFRIHKNSKGGSRYKEQFREEIAVAKQYQKNQFLIFLHSLHNKVINLSYSILK
ncbi:glycosyltransferase family 2 protein [Longitalea luteola]|uniref:glycosyltransferase family 2 protein n=1 Tax=Longitalea luteola TaxID=2812563 RepID=UPI001A9637DA|nr:glycosyltransferase family 2 protein [Longitalea luteola]